MVLEKILEKSPWIEVAVRTVYWRSQLVNRMLAARAKRIQRVPKEKGVVSQDVHFDDVLAMLKELGVGQGRIAIVHSSGSELRPTGLSPKQICEKLLEFVGPTGTLAAPCIPYYAEEPTGLARLTDDICSKRLLYDVQLTPTWTGALSKALSKCDGAIRSRHPLNSMVALGPDAEPMMRENISGYKPLPCGEGSSWKYCADNEADIVCLGVDMAHSLTMIHVAEDAWYESWPISNWYRDRLFHIRDGDFSTDLTVRERRPKWAINYAERTLKRDLILSGILKHGRVGSLSVEVCNSRSLIDFLRGRNRRGYPYYFPFWERC